MGDEASDALGSADAVGKTVASPVGSGVPDDANVRDVAADAENEGEVDSDADALTESTAVAVTVIVVEVEGTPDTDGDREAEGDPDAAADALVLELDDAHGLAEGVDETSADALKLEESEDVDVSVPGRSLCVGTDDGEKMDGVGAVEAVAATVSELDGEAPALCDAECEADDDSDGDSEERGDADDDTDEETDDEPEGECDGDGENVTAVERDTVVVGIGEVDEHVETLTDELLLLLEEEELDPDGDVPMLDDAAAEPVKTLADGELELTVEAEADGQPDAELDSEFPEPVGAAVSDCETVVETERVAECVVDADSEGVPLVHGDDDGDLLVLRVTVPERDCVSDTVPDGLLLGLHDG